MKVCGIYLIKNIKNGKVYVGKSVDIKRRWKNHNYCLRHNKNQPNPHLQNAWNRDGKDSFEFVILEECEVEKLKEKEEYWINKLESWNREKGYNLEKYSCEKVIVSKETLQKMSNSMKGKMSGKNHPLYGKHHSKETKQKISESNKGRVISIESKRKISNALKGKNNSNYKKQFSYMHRKKISEAKKGQHLSFETKRKISESTKGEKGNNSKLTWEQVREIRAKYIPYKYTAKMLMKEYNVGETTIWHILNFETWKEK